MIQINRLDINTKDIEYISNIVCNDTETFYMNFEFELRIFLNYNTYCYLLLFKLSYVRLFSQQNTSLLLQLITLALTPLSIARNLQIIPHQKRRSSTPPIPLHKTNPNFHVPPKYNSCLYHHLPILPLTKEART